LRERRASESTTDREKERERERSLGRDRQRESSTDRDRECDRAETYVKPVRPNSRPLIGFLTSNRYSRKKKKNTHTRNNTYENVNYQLQSAESAREFHVNVVCV
jgi:hypothetical protein